MGSSETVSRFEGDIKLSSVVHTPEGCDAIQRDLDKVKKWACVNITRFNKAKYRVLYVGQDNSPYSYTLEDEGIESSLEEKDLGVLVNEKLSMTQQHVLAAQKASHMLGCFKRIVASRSRDMVLALYFTLMKPHLQPSV